jgi:hypothetical protein
MWEKGKSIKKQIKLCTHIHICQQKNEMHKKCIIKMLWKFNNLND